MRWTLAAVLVVVGCDGGGEDTAAEAPVVDADVYEYECVLDEDHVFTEVRFTPGEWVEAQLWREVNPEQWGVSVSPNAGWWGGPPTLTADGLALCDCASNDGSTPLYLGCRLLVRR